LGVTTSKPSLDLLTELTDQHVLAALIDEPRLTRAELAVLTGISKPTVGESVKRLTEVGMIRDTGERTTGRGRVGTYYALNKDVGSALTVSIAPEGVVAETINVRGQTLSRVVEVVPRPAGHSAVEYALRTAVSRVRHDTGPAVRLTVVSAADPVDRATGRLVQLPDAPFLVGELDAVTLLGELVGGPVLVDNDVNWAALAERSADPSPSLDNYVYVYLGEGLGAAVVSDGEVRRGNSGMSGEIAHLVTTGPSGRPVPFTEVFNELHLRHTGSTAIDVSLVLAAVSASGTVDRTAVDAIAAAVCGVLAAAVAFIDPAVIVIGGAWGTHPTVMEAIGTSFEQLPRHVPLRPATVIEEAPLTGARHRALQDLRAAVTGYRRVPSH
jgi:predicted NBD/HSP70 family sugar kinase